MINHGVGTKGIEMSQWSLTKLEQAVLGKIALKNPSVQARLQIQIDSATVVNRRNTGAGFYCEFNVRKPTEPIIGRVYGNIFITVSGLNNPMSCVLFIKDGFLDQLEGASVDEDTSQINFLKVKFSILKLSP